MRIIRTVTNSITYCAFGFRSDLSEMRTVHATLLVVMMVTYDGGISLITENVQPVNIYRKKK
jgi:hypothetical protein